MFDPFDRSLYPLCVEQTDPDMARPVPVIVNPAASADDEPWATRSGHPAGPVLRHVRATHPLRTRGQAWCVFAGCAAIIALSAWLVPDPSGDGTHQQLGLPPCSSLVIMGYPCPTCGMTTAFAHTVRGQLVSAFSAQPAGLVAALGVIASAVLSLYVACTGRVIVVNWYRISPSWVIVGVILLILAGWGYKLAVGMATGKYPVGL